MVGPSEMMPGPTGLRRPHREDEWPSLYPNRGGNCKSPTGADVSQKVPTKIKAYEQQHCRVRQFPISSPTAAAGGGQLAAARRTCQCWDGGGGGRHRGGLHRVGIAQRRCGPAELAGAGVVLVATADPRDVRAGRSGINANRLAATAARRLDGVAPLPGAASRRAAAARRRGVLQRAAARPLHPFRGPAGGAASMPQLLSRPAAGPGGFVPRPSEPPRVSIFATK